MGKPKLPNFRNNNLQLRKRIEGYITAINNVYDTVAKKAAQMAFALNHEEDKPFSFSDYPSVKKQILDIQSWLASQVEAIIQSSSSEEWNNCNVIQNLVADKVLKQYTGTTKHGEEYSRYYLENTDALKAFQERKENGLSLSDNVWRITEPFKSELEESITAAIGDGTSAMELATQVKQYLKDPDKRFRRIRDKVDENKLHLSNPAKAYHPGAGRYRSSARNAQRLARTEINMAYRTAEQTRWGQFDFVVGYEVKTTQNGHHVEDICDDLAGKYPKDFIFKGWHPNCMCYCIPILKTEEEFWAQDSEDSTESVNEVKDVPEGFKEWIKSNKDRIEAAEERGKLPYFIQDNKDEVMGILYPELHKKSALEIAEERHAARTQEDIGEIRTNWGNRKVNQLWDAVSDELLPEACAEKIEEIKEDILFGDFDTAMRKAKVLDTAAMRHSKRTTEDLQLIQDTWDKHRLDGLSDIIPDAGKWFYDEGFSIKELQTTKKAVQKYISDYSYQSLTDLKATLLSEADWVKNHPKYSTSVVAEAAYLYQAKLIDKKLYWEGLKNQSNALKLKLGDRFKKHFDKIDEAINNQNWKSAEANLYSLGKWDKIISFQKEANANGVDTKVLESYIKGNKLNKAWDEYNKLSSSGSVDLEEYCNKHYTTAFTIHDHDSYKKHIEEMIADCRPHWLAAPIEERQAIIDYTGSYSNRMIVDRAMGISNERVKHMDSLLDKITLSNDMVLRSGQDYGVARILFGDDFADVLETGDITSLNSKFKGAKALNKGYMSTSYNELGGFGKDWGKEIEFHIFAPKGTHGMVANQISVCAEGRGVNWNAEDYREEWRSDGESEFILHGGQIYKFIKAERGDFNSVSGIRIYLQIIGKK